MNTKNRAVGCILYACVFFLSAQMMHAQGFIRSLKEGGENYENITSLAVAPSGHIFIIGEFNSSTTIGGVNLTSEGREDIFVAKLNPDGSAAWVRQGGGPNNDRGIAVVPAAGGGCYISGSFVDSIRFGDRKVDARKYYNREPFKHFLGKFNADGRLEWLFSEDGSYTTAMATDSEGGLHATGHVDSAVLFDDMGLGGPGAFLVDYTSGGGVLRPQVFPGSGSLTITDIAFYDDANIYITGTFSGTLELEKGPMKHELVSKGGRDFFVAKIASRRIRWAYAAGGSGDEWGTGICATPDGGCVVVGNFDDSISFQETGFRSTPGGPPSATDMFIVRYNESGRVIWARQAGLGDHDVVQGVAAAQDGGFYIAGNFNHLTTFGPIRIDEVFSGGGNSDVFVAKYDGDGNPVWALPAGSSMLDECAGIGVDSLGNIHIAGFIEGTARFGATELVSEGGRDIYIATISSPSGVTDNAENFPRGTPGILSTSLQVMPNPSSGNAVASFNLPHHARVRLTLVDALGEESPSFAEGMMAPGHHTIPLPVTGRADGVYMIRLAVDGEITTRKFLVVSN